MKKYFILICAVSFFIIILSWQGSGYGFDLINNGDFSLGKEYWEEFHNSKAGDEWSLQILKEPTGNNYAQWFRINSSSDGGGVGLKQIINQDVSYFNQLIFSCDIKVLSHSLPNTGWWAEVYGGTGEMPVKVEIYYEDIEGKQQEWGFGFLADLGEQEDLAGHEDRGIRRLEEKWEKSGTARRRRRHISGKLTNFLLVKKDEWTPFEIDLLGDGKLNDKFGKSLPRPKIIKEIRVLGSGWDFSGAIANIKLIGL